MKRAFTVFLLIFCTAGWAQTLPQLQPISVEPLNLSYEGEADFKERKENCTDYSDPICDETVISYWETETAACSWYCGGGPDTIWASSYLPAQSGVSYLPKNAHNWSYETAWVEGVPGYGVGERITYRFKAASPRVGSFIIAGGYVKTREAWENNSRVKSLKVYVDGVPFAILHLNDFRARQTFKLAKPIGYHPDSWESFPADLTYTISFEILAVYPGKKYQDTAISQLEFDGPDSHSMTGNWD